MAKRGVIKLLLNPLTLECSYRDSNEKFTSGGWSKDMLRRFISLDKRDCTSACFLGQVDVGRWTYGVIATAPEGVAGVWLDLVPVHDEDLVTVNRENRFRFVEDVLGKIPANIAVFDLEHRYRYVNVAAIRNQELRDWIIGKTDMEYCVHRGWDPVIAEERARYFRLCIQTQQEISWEEVMRVNDEERTFLRRFYPVFLDSGEIDFVIGYGLELTALRQAEKKLRDNEEQYRNIIQNSSDIIYTTDGNGDFTFVNDGAQKLTGFAVSDIIGQSYITMVREDHRSHVLRFYTEQIQQGKQESYLEFPIVTADERTVWIGQNVRFVYADGGLIRVEAVARDITERKLKEEELLSVVNSLDDVVMQVDEEYRFLNVWAKDDSLLMIPSSKFLGKTFRQVLGDMARMFEDEVRKVVANGQSSLVEYQLPGMDKWFTARFTPSPLTGYSRRKISVLIQDITEKKIALETIERNTNNLAALIDNTEDKIWSVDRDFHLLSFNMAFTSHMRDKWNWTPGIGDKLPFHLFDAETAKFWIRCLDSAFSGEFYETERVRSLNGEVRYDEYSFNPIRNKNGSIVGAAIFGRNITSRRLAEEELKSARAAAERSSSIRQQFIANMSHEIRTPMNAIMGSTHLLMAEELPAQHRELVRTIQESSGFLLSMINDILDLSKIDSGKLVMDKSPFELGTIRDTLQTSLRSMAESKGLDFKVAVDSSLLDQHFVGDSTRLLQVLFNLTGNAIKFTDKGSVQVRIKAINELKSEKFVSITVTDTGIGISEEQLERIFTPFGQGDYAVTRKYGGTGLGLAISRRIIRAMGGDLRVLSTPGSGSTFSFDLSLPLVEVAVSANAETQPINVSEGAKVLIAEDHDFNRYYLSRILEKNGFVVVCAENGRLAYEKYLENPDVNLVILDIRMPEWDGFEALRRIRELPGGEKVRIIAHTAHVLQKEKDEVMAAGFNGLVEKPVEPERLMEVIHRVIHEPVQEVPMVKVEPDLEFLRRSFSDPAIFNEVLINLQSSLEDHTSRLEKMNIEGNYEQLYEVFHKIKPSASMLRLKELLEIMPELDEFHNWTFQQKQEAARKARRFLLETMKAISGSAEVTVFKSS